MRLTVFTLAALLVATAAIGQTRTLRVGWDPQLGPIAFMVSMDSAPAVQVGVLTDPTCNCVASMPFTLATGPHIVDVWGAYLLNAFSLPTTLAFQVLASSPDGTLLPPATSVVDNAGNLWTIGTPNLILENGTQASGGLGSKIGKMTGGAIVVFGDDSQWWQWNGSGWFPIGTATPAGLEQVAPLPTDPCAVAPLTFRVTQWQNNSPGSRQFRYAWSGVGPITITLTTTSAVAVNPGGCRRTVTR